MFFVEPNLAGVGWRDTLFAASKPAAQSCDKQRDTTSQQTMHFDRFPGNVCIDLLKYYTTQL